VKTVHRQCAPAYIQAADAYPVFCDLLLLVAVFYSQPFSLMYGAEDVTVNCIHVSPFPAFDQSPSSAVFFSKL
jgi:hypothetical protein